MSDLGTAQVIRANSRSLPIADNSVDLVVTSPPYFALRSYQDGGEHYAGQIGDEPTPAAFVESLLEVTAECVRVLKPSGSLWVNLGDKYSGAPSGPRSGGILNPGGSEKFGRSSRIVSSERIRSNPVVPTKSLIGIPWRYALRCIDDLGLILRAEVIWSKPNGLPESVTDRVRRSHEQWFCFEQSGGVEAAAQSFPFCPLCGRPVDARTALVQRLKELDRGVESGDLASHVGPDESVDREHARGRDADVTVGAGGASVPVVEGSDAEGGVDASHLVEHGVASVVDPDAQDRPALSVDEGHGALAVDDSGKPADVCECVGHPLIINDEPWLPQSLSAEIMQRVADGEIDAQQAADFLSGDYVRNHSVWFHFTLQPRYFSAVDEIREPHQATKQGRGTEGWRPGPSGQNRGTEVGRTHEDGDPLRYFALSPLGKLPGSVWEVPTEPLRVPDHLGVDHFAAFPTEWPKRIIAGWSPAGVCVECGEGLVPVVIKEGGRPVARAHRHLPGYSDPAGEGMRDQSYRIEGYSCSCPPKSPTNTASARTGAPSMEPTPTTTTALAAAAGGSRPHIRDATVPTRPAVVLDPFGGTGTTAMVAKALGRHGISVDMSADYCRLAEWRTNDRNQLAKVLGIAKTEAADPHQLDLFGESA